jgi:hypothetical protein
VPTYDLPEQVFREFQKLSLEQQRRFLRALGEFVQGLRQQPPTFPPRLRVKRVQGHPGVWELSFAGDGRATFEYGAEQSRGEPHVVWRRIGDQSIVRSP